MLQYTVQVIKGLKYAQRIIIYNLLFMWSWKAKKKAYQKVHNNLMVIPDSIQGNIARVRNYILDNSETDWLVMVDDDLKYIGCFNGHIHKKLDEQEVYDMILKGFQMAEDLGVKLWGLNIVGDKGSYREYTPFNTNGMILGPFNGHLKHNLRYDETIPLKEDYDLSLQMLNKFRKTLRLNMYHYNSEQNTIVGGCASYRNTVTEMEQFELLRKKWGNKIVKRDNQGDDRQKHFDINPVIKVPIKGV